MSAEYEGWAVSCDFKISNTPTDSSYSRTSWYCKAVVHFDQPGVTSDSLYTELDKVGWTYDDYEHYYCPAHPYE